MKAFKQRLPGVTLIAPDVFYDNRGSFRRNFCTAQLAEIGISFTVYQGNISENPKKYTLRGFHYQKFPSNESKILTPLSGTLYNVVLDLRPTSNTYLQWLGMEISSERKESLYIPTGCANAFLTTEVNTVVHYYMSDSFRPETYAGIRYNDPLFNIVWPHEPLFISEKDRSFSNFTVGQL
jgi:dTDP-4-dehydrorhamnose 3,5-epimerase